MEHTTDNREVRSSNLRGPIADVTADYESADEFIRGLIADENVGWEPLGDPVRGLTLFFLFLLIKCFLENFIFKRPISLI